MDKLKITDLEISENGVEGAAHYFYGDPDENQKIFDKLPKLIATKFNAFVEYIKNNFCTKTEADEKISNKVKELGAGDMTKAVYDADGDGTVDRAFEADNVRGFWFAKEDADGNPTDEPYIHWWEE